MVRVLMLLFLVELVITSLALISSLSVESIRDVRLLPRAAWVVVILLVPIVGAVAWFLVGRPVPARPGAGSRPGRPTAAAPDDDPEFLRSLARQDRRERELFNRWEADLATPSGGGGPSHPRPAPDRPSGNGPDHPQPAPDHSSGDEPNQPGPTPDQQPDGGLDLPQDGTADPDPRPRPGDPDGAPTTDEGTDPSR